MAGVDRRTESQLTGPTTGAKSPPAVGTGMDRRRILRTLGGAIPISLAGCLGGTESDGESGDTAESVHSRTGTGTETKPPSESSARGPVYVASAEQGRASAISSLLEHFETGFDGQRVAVKANFNSADSFPASTHPETLEQLLDHIGSDDVVLAERSGMGETPRVLENLGVVDLARERGVAVEILDDVDADRWTREQPTGSHWDDGFLFPDVFADADAVVQTCCLKTHRYGGHFTMALKNSVGMVAKTDPTSGYDYMSELHHGGDQRKKIAEINAVYEPAFVLMDGVKAFTAGGPASGELVEPGILLASRDRVAIDAAGVAVLRSFGTTREVGTGPIFDQDQIARAVDLGLGAERPADIDVVPVDGAAEDAVETIREELDA